MNILTKYSGFLAVLCVVNGASAATTAQSYRPSTATARVSLATTPTTTAAMQARRIPTMTKTGTVTTTTTTTDTSLLTSQECIEKYTECIHDSNACGTDFEECTTTPLFYTKKPQCNSVLLQCGTDGINALFGTSNTTLFANKDSDGNFVYPTAGSILGQFIEAGHIANLLDKSQCVKRVTSCLHKENVCGADFELCTSNAEFKKQKVFCESTIARCQNDGITELFGSSDATANPTTTSRLGVLITEGAELAAVNAVSTCYKVADQCILSTCSANPYKCITDSAINIADIVAAINDGTTMTEEQARAASDARTAAMVNSFIRGACLDTVGGNKYCHMTVNGGKVPSSKDLIDEDSRDEVYSDIYASRMNTAMRAKIQGFADDFDKKTKDKCSDTIMSCAMRSCGSGLGSLCYKKVFGTGSKSADFKNSINGDSTYAEIERGCASIVNTDANCQYAAVVGGNNGTYSYKYTDSSTFGTLFPTTGLDDPLGVVDRLNAALADNYNDAAIAQLAKQCRATAVSCIKSMCGADYTNCYRNRTDIMSDTYDTGNAAFDHSMNKVGGVLDFNIIRGLCVETVKNASTCDEHLKINSVRYMSDRGANGWGTDDVRTAWNDAVSSGYKQSKSYDVEVLVGCTVGNATTDVCKNKQNNPNLIEDCDYIDEDGCVYNQPYYQTETDYAFSMASDTLFQEVLGDIEKEAQAKYNAKLTQEQNMCVAANNGGLMGARDMSGTYMWVKLKSKRTPKNYSTAGLKVNDFVASNDLYGSFCRARVTIQSDDPDIQSALQQKNQNWSTAYFAVGDVFTCGSWIPQDKLEDIAKKVAARKTGKDEKGTLSNSQGWIVAGTSILSAGAGAVGMDLLQGRTGLGGLLNTNTKNRNECAMNVQSEIDYWSSLSFDSTCRNRKVEGCTGDDCEECIKDRSITGSGTIFQKSAAGKSAFGKTLKTTAGTVVTKADVSSRINELNGYLTDICGADDKSSMWGRAGLDALGAAAVALPTSFAVRDTMRASNRAEFTEAQQEFMNNVGDHIYCFIGADEAGTYGDLIEISIE